jgi:hypothetical protein
MCGCCNLEDRKLVSHPVTAQPIANTDILMKKLLIFTHTYRNNNNNNSNKDDNNNNTDAAGKTEFTWKLLDQSIKLARQNSNFTLSSPSEN